MNKMIRSTLKIGALMLVIAVLVMSVAIPAGAQTLRPQLRHCIQCRAR